MTDFNEEDPILKKVQKLVDKAWSTTFPEERDALLAKADALMLRYSIDQFMLLDPKRENTAAPIKGQSPEMREMWYFGEGVQPYNVLSGEDEVLGSIHTLFWYLAQHLHVKIGHFGWAKSKVVGYPADLDFLEMMFLSLKLHLLSKVDPKVTPELSWEMNLCALKQAGYKWEEIHKKLNRLPDYPLADKPWVSGGKGFSIFPSTYQRWLKANPDEQKNFGSPQMWRRSFVQAYVYEIQNRLHEMASASAKTIDNLPALLKSKDSILDELFNELFPPAEPVKADPNAKTKPVRYRYVAPKAMSTQAMAAGRAAARTADLNQRGARVGGSTERAIGG